MRTTHWLMIAKSAVTLSYWPLWLALLMADVSPPLSLAATANTSSTIRVKGVSLEEKYRLGKFFVITSPKGKANDAVTLLVDVAVENPLYKNTLTLLGAAYYWQGNNYEASKFSSRALAVKKDDEIAWLIYGLTQLKLEEHRKGTDSLKAGLTLLNKQSKSGNLESLSPPASIRRDFRRAVFAVDKADPAQKAETINAVENLLLRIIEEASENVRSKWISYDRTQYGFGIELPPDWLPVEKPEGFDAAQTTFKVLNPGMAGSLGQGRTVFTAFSWPPRQTSFEMVGIETLDLPSETNLNDIGAVFAARLETMRFVEKPVSNRVILDVGEAGQFLYRLTINTPGGQAIRVINNYLIVHERTLYQLVHSTTVDREEQSRPIFERIVRSFRWSK